jgi:hypothetical protein
MSDKINLVRVLTATTGNSTPITLGAAYSQLFMTPQEAGAIDGRTYTWLIVDGNNWELVRGAYTASGTTMARTTVLASRSGGVLGTSRISLSGTAQVRIVDSAADMDGVRGTRSVAGTSDALASTDQGYVVAYNNAAAVAVSLAQAGTAGLLDGWACWVRNRGAGAVTITPTTSTVNGAATLVLPTNMGAFIWSDGTNYHAFVVPVTAPLLAANNLADVANAATALGNLKGVSYGAAQSLTAAQQDQARANIAIVGRNKIVNGGFTVNQRVYVSSAALAAGVYAHDRWKAGASGCTYTFTQSGNPFTTITITAGSLQQIIEGVNIEGGTYTLSWTGTAQGKINGGTVASSPLTVAGLTAGSNVTVEFGTGTLGSVQFEIGSVASPFEFRPISVEIAQCQRYYETNYNTGVAPGSVVNIIPDMMLFSHVSGGLGMTMIFQVRKRAAPTMTIYDAVGAAGKVTYYNGSWTNGGAISSQTQSSTAFYVQSNITNALQSALMFTASAEL